MAQYYEAVLGPDPLRRRLHEIFSYQQPPTPLHEFLAGVPVPLLTVTTNYDTLMEKALDEIDAPYDVGAYRADSQSLAVITHGSEETKFVTSYFLSDVVERTVVFRLHGPAIKNERRTGAYVMTEEDQIDWLARLGTQSTPLPRLVTDNIRRNNLLSLEHSARDWSQRALLRALL
jgi:SIR2-like domain